MGEPSFNELKKLSGFSFIHDATRQGKSPLTGKSPLVNQGGPETGLNSIIGYICLFLIFECEQWSSNQNMGTI